MKGTMVIQRETFAIKCFETKNRYSYQKINKKRSDDTMLHYYENKVIIQQQQK